MSEATTSDPAEPSRRQPGDPGAQPGGLLSDLRAATSSDEVALKVLVASAVVLAVGWLGVKAAVGGVIASQVLSEAVKRWVERRKMSIRRKWLIALLLLLLERAKEALAAIRRAFRIGPGAGRPSAALTNVLATAITVILFTGPELVLGDSLLADRKTTFFGGRYNTRGPEPPTLVMPGALVRDAISARGATVTYTVTAHVPGGRTIPVACSPPSGSRLSLGTSTVFCSAAAPGRPEADGTFRVTVADRTPPRLKLPTPVRRSTRSRHGATITYAATAFDAVSGSVTPECRPRSRTRFDIGTTKVTCEAKDSAGNKRDGSFLVTVRRDASGGGTGRPDRTPPTLDVPVRLRVEAISSRGALVRYRARARDAVDGALNPTCSPASGIVLAIRTHTVRCSVADAAGNVKADDFRVTVFDAPPVISVPKDIRQPYRKPYATTVTYEAVWARDRIDGYLPAKCSPKSGRRFRMGTTVVTCTATDAAGNEASASFNVTIVDEIPPELTVKDIARYADGPVEVHYDKDISAVDAVDDFVEITCDPRSGSIFKVGTTTVTCRARDDAGNEDTGSFKVTVHGPPD